MMGRIFQIAILIVFLILIVRFLFSREQKKAIHQRFIWLARLLLLIVAIMIMLRLWFY